MLGAGVGLAIVVVHLSAPVELSTPVDGAVSSAAGRGVAEASGPLAVQAPAEEVGLTAVLDTMPGITDAVPLPSLSEAGPIRLDIPSAHLEQGPVEAVEVNEQSRLVPPASAVGWYRNEAGLGRPGSALFVGHIAYDGENGPFRRLEAVRPGDEVSVELEDGSSYTYVVESAAVYRKEAVPFEALVASSGPDRIALVTCTGSFDERKRSYDSNLVVVAVRPA